MSNKEKYVYRIRCFQAVYDEYITAENNEDVIIQAGKVFDSFYLTSERGDYCRQEIALCSECNEWATKIVNDYKVFCDSCFADFESEKEDINNG